MADTQKNDEIGRQLTQTELIATAPGRQSHLNEIRIVLQPKCQEECVISRVLAVKQSILQFLLEILAYLFTAGILFILVNWFKEWRYKLFFSIVDIQSANSVVVFGPDGDVQIISLVDSLYEAQASSSQQQQLPVQPLKQQSQQLQSRELKQNSLDKTGSPQNSQLIQKSNTDDLPIKKPHSGMNEITIQQSHQDQQQTVQQQHTSSKGFRLEKSVFSYRFNKYQYNGSEFVPYGDQPTNFTNANLDGQHKFGLTAEQIVSSRERNGMNKTDIPDKGVIHLTFEELFSPFYLFQVGSFILWMYEGYRIYAYIILSTSTLSTIFKIYEERLNFARLRKFSYFRGTAVVLRNQVKETISTHDLSFGDRIFLKENEIAPCDVVVVQGSAIVNESMLTGESIPIVKTAISLVAEQFSENKQNVIYCGSQISQISSDLECIVVRIGFETLKGNLIRSIMYPKSHSQISFANDSGKFILILASVAVISFFVSLSTFLEKLDLELMEPKDVVIRCLDLLTISVPPALPTCLSFGVSFSLKRLRKKNVFCIQPEKINICGIVRTICFDKTGTLTEEKLSFKLVATYIKSALAELKSSQELDAISKTIMSSCHSLMLFQGKPAGDPLDAEMFESTGAQLLAENAMPLLHNERNGIKVVQEIAVDGNIQNRDASNVISVLKRFQFEAEVERMSAIVALANDLFVVVKGSPEKIRTICTADSIPNTFDETLSKYTQEGYRVIALSYKKLDSTKPIDDSKERDFYENALTFGGFLVFENKLKPETTAHIALQQHNSVQIHMVTGDNPLTSLSVAKQCGILNVNRAIHVCDVVFEDRVPYSILNGQKKSVKDILDMLNPGKVEFVMTGMFFAHFLEPLKEVKESKIAFSTFLSSTKVYARMKPDQKQSLIRLLQAFLNPKQGYSFIGMCGDGANDCQALKDADMGISLGEAEASIAASFTSKIVNISVIEFILREGRCCLATSFQCFKFMSLYSIIQCTTTAILYQRGAVPGDFQFLYWDLFIIIPLAFLIGLTDPSEKLTQRTPPHRLFSHQNIISVIGLGVIQFVFLIVVTAVTATQEDWYMSPLDINKLPDMDPAELLSNSFDNAVLFWVSNFQYICSVIAFSIGSEHKKAFFTNIYFTFFLVAIIGLSIFSLFSTDSDYASFFEIEAIAYDATETAVSEMPYSWRWVIAGFIVANIVINIIFEKYILPVLTRLYEKWSPNSIYHGAFVADVQSNNAKVGTTTTTAAINLKEKDPHPTELADKAQTHINE